MLSAATTLLLFQQPSPMVMRDNTAWTPIPRSYLAPRALAFILHNMAPSHRAPAGYQVAINYIGLQTTYRRKSSALTSVEPFSAYGFAFIALLAFLTPPHMKPCYTSCINIASSAHHMGPQNCGCGLLAWGSPV